MRTNTRQSATRKPKPSSSKRSRKSRTQVVESSSSGSSDSGASNATAPPKPRKKRRTTTPSSSSSPSNGLGKVTDTNDSKPHDRTAITTASAPTPAAAFRAWYLRTVTQELAEDLDRVRGAPDFRDAALPLLVHALEQGGACFSPAEKARVMMVEMETYEKQEDA